MSEAPAVQPVAYECRHAVYAPNRFERGDIHLVKEIQHFADGTTKPHVRLIKNYQRKIGITKKGFQDHESKKEAELLERLDVVTTTQSEMLDTIKKVMGVPWSKDYLRKVCASPYIYGADIRSEAIIKRQYQEKWPINMTAHSVAVIDTETSVLSGQEEVLLCSISFKEKALIAANKDFVKNVPNYVERVHAALELYMGETLKRRNMTVEVRVCENDFEVIKACIDRAHEWKPDFLSGWNSLFDWEKILQTCQRHGVDPADLLSDPAVPKPYRFCKLKVGPATRETASGKVMNFKPAHRWHTLEIPASFYPVDSMCTYRYVRLGTAELPEYNLDYVANLILKRGKLNIPGMGINHDLEWHATMQKSHPVEYSVYNLADCVVVEEIDEITVDLAVSLPMLSGCSHYADFKSQPRRKVDDLHFVYLKNGRMIATTGPDMKDDDDAETATLSDWIVMMPAERLVANGLQCILENCNWVTNIRIANSDLDVSAAYPTNQIVCNASKATTMKEVIKLGRLDEQTKRRNMINFSGGKTNDVEFCTVVLGLPEMDVMLQAYEAELAMAA